MDWLFEGEYRWVLVFLLLGLLFLTGAIANGALFYWARRKIGKSIQTTATVIDHVMRIERQGHSPGIKVKVYHEVFEWVANGIRYEQVSETRYEVAPRHAIGDKVEAYYSYEEPNKILTKTDDEAYKTSFTLWSLACVIFTLIGLVFKFLI